MMAVDVCSCSLPSVFCLPFQTCSVQGVARWLPSSQHHGGESRHPQGMPQHSCLSSSRRPTGLPSIIQPLRRMRCLEPGFSSSVWSVILVDFSPWSFLPQGLSTIPEAPHITSSPSASRDRKENMVSGASFSSYFSHLFPHIYIKKLHIYSSGLTFLGALYIFSK